MQIQLAYIPSGIPQIFSEAEFEDCQVQQNIDSILFDGPVADGLQYMIGWLEHRSISLLDFYLPVASTRGQGMALAFNMAAGFEDVPALLLIYFAYPSPTMLVLAHHLDRSFLPLLDTLVGKIPTHFIVSGEPEASLLTAYLRLTGRNYGYPKPKTARLDSVYARWHQHRWRELLRGA